MQDHSDLRKITVLKPERRLDVKYQTFSQSEPFIMQPLSAALFSAFLSLLAGVEILFDLYNTTLQKIEVLKLEKRLDEELFYLRDAHQEYSTVPFDFEPVPLPKGASVPVNTTKVSSSCCCC